MGNYGEIDNLTYTYDPNDLNRIRKIADGTSTINATKGFRFANSSDLEDYKYDDNGNLKYDKNKNITNITYNYLNLPETIEIQVPGSTNLSKIIFVYDASGYKHRKITRTYTSSTLTSETITDYISGYEYSVSTTNGTFANPENSILERVHHAEGAITKQAGSAVFQYEYALRDHLGNTRVTFKDKDNNGTIDYSNVDASINEVSQINHYYPYGLNMEGNWNGASGANKYTYNGKEWNDDSGLGWYAYGFRYYDPSACRFWSRDPLSEDFFYYTPYQFAGNRVPNAIDLEGLEEFLVIKSYDENNHITSIAINYHTNSEGLVNQKLSNKNTGEDYSNFRVLNVSINADGSINYNGAESFDQLTQSVYDNKTDVTTNRTNTDDNSMSIGESRDLQSTSNEKISTSHRKSGQIGINQDFEFQFNKNTFDKGKETSTSNYLNGIKTSLNSDNVPVYKIDGKNSNKIRSELEKRGVDSKKENRKMTSNIPLTSSSRVLYGRYFVK